MWRWVVFFLFLLKKQQHLEHKKITSEPAAAHGFLPASVDCTHPKGRPPSTLRTLEAVGCLPGKPKEAATLLQTLSSKGCRQGRAQAGVFERMKKASFLV